MAVPGRLVVAISHRKSAGYMALLVCAWGLTLAPLLHSLHHRDDHRHGPTGGAEPSEWHVHADGTAHDGPLADAPLAPLDPMSEEERDTEEYETTVSARLPVTAASALTVRDREREGLSKRQNEPEGRWRCSAALCS